MNDGASHVINSLEIPDYVVAICGPLTDGVGAAIAEKLTRAGGRGVGLYLSKVNLEAGRHTIRYAQDDDPRVLPGANFVIELRGVSDGSGTV